METRDTPKIPLVGVLAVKKPSNLGVGPFPVLMVRVCLDEGEGGLVEGLGLRGGEVAEDTLGDLTVQFQY